MFSSCFGYFSVRCLKEVVFAPKIRSLCPLLDQNASIHKHKTKRVLVIWSSGLPSRCTCVCWLCYQLPAFWLYDERDGRMTWLGKTAAGISKSEIFLCPDSGQLWASEWPLEKKRVSKGTGNSFCQSGCGTVVGHCPSIAFFFLHFCF